MGAIASRSSSNETNGVADRSLPEAATRRNASEPANQPEGASPVADTLGRLTHIRPGRHRIITCYLKLEARDRTRGKYLIKMKNRVRDAIHSLSRLGLERETVHEIERDLERLQQYLRNPANLPHTQGVAIFASEGLGLFEAVPLPVVHRSRLAVDQSPLVRELASVEDEFGRLLTVVLDRASARFFEVTAYRTRELPGRRANSTRGKRFHGDHDGPSGWGEHTYHNRIREEKQRHYEAIARELFTIYRRHPADGIVLAGTGAEAAVEPFLHSYLAERLIGTARLNPKDASPASVHSATLAVREGYERASERVLVHEMLEGVGTGWAVNGLQPTLRALSRGQVRALLVHADASEPGFRCGDSGRLALTPRECRGEGEPIPVLDVIDDAIEEALRQRVNVNVVYESEARDSIQGLGALLRFR
jgi:peptide subunit release factor 1 (eRF1)